MAIRKGLIALFIFNFLSGVAQNESSMFQIKELSLAYGMEWENVSETPFASEIDYFNFFDSTPEGFDYDFLRVNCGVRIGKKFEVYTGVAVDDNFTPSKYSLDFIYRKQDFGFLLGVFRNEVAIADFNNFFKRSRSDFYAYQNASNMPDFARTELFLSGFKAGLTYQLVLTGFQFDFSLNSGLVQINSFNESILSKQKTGNMVILENYKSKKSLSPFLLPEMRMFVPIIKNKLGKIGLISNVGFFSGKFENNYHKESYEWTLDNPVNSYISNQPHSYRKFQFSFGIAMLNGRQ